jgi:phosphatidylglycerophosphate synthase
MQWAANAIGDLMGNKYFSNSPMNDPASSNRRPLKTRDARWATALAKTLTKLGVSPNTISVASGGFAALAGVSLWGVGLDQGDWHRRGLLVIAAAGVQMRLLCNMLDGMVAIEGGCRTKSGELFNELPDRISDALVFIGAAYAAPSCRWTLELGWSVAVLSVITAYVRALGVTMGAGQQFLGPMAKPHRMAAVTIACFLGALAPLYISEIIPVALAVIALGCVLTLYRRCRRILMTVQAQ